MTFHIVRMPGLCKRIEQVGIAGKQQTPVPSFSRSRNSPCFKGSPGFSGIGMVRAKGKERLSMKKILLADDDAAIRQTLGQVLTLEQYDVVFAATGREAAAKFIAVGPDLVLLDLNMPDRDGWDAFDLMNQTHPLVPVIVITARPQQYEHAAKLGIDALMEKPLNLSLLLATIADLLAESEAERGQRLIDPGFKTTYLSQPIESCPNGASQ
jgi:CheY-like chemotaxis protein